MASFRVCFEFDIINVSPSPKELNLPPQFTGKALILLNLYDFTNPTQERPVTAVV